MAVHISFETANFHDHARAVGEINEGSSSEREDELLQQLDALRADLERSDQLLAAIASLEAAIREQNKPGIQSIMRQLTSNFTSSLLANVLATAVNPLLQS